MVFDQPGDTNTTTTLQIAIEKAKKRKITHLIVASTRGKAGVEAARLIQGSPLKLVVVTHNTGFKEPGKQEFDPELKKEIESLGGIVYTGTMVLRGLGAAIRNKTGYSHEALVADTLRMFGQGVKVCIEIVAMTCDAGLIPFEDVIAVAGTSKGADTCAVIEANSSNQFFQIKVREILAKPRNF